MNIAGKKAVVIGGASGLGGATAEALVTRGAEVAVLDQQNAGGDRFYPARCDAGRSDVGESGPHDLDVPRRGRPEHGGATVTIRCTTVSASVWTAVCGGERFEWAMI